MFVLKSTHEKLLAAEKSRCDAVISQMSEQISDLRRLVFVPTLTHVEALPAREANAVLDGKETLPKSTPEEEAKELAEANRILSGDYDNFEDSLV